MITDNSHFVVFCKLDHWVEGKTSSGATDGNYVSEKNFGYNLKITDTWKPRTHGNHGHMETTDTWKPRTHGNHGHMEITDTWTTCKSGQGMKKSKVSSPFLKHPISQAFHFSSIPFLKHQGMAS